MIAKSANAQYLAMLRAGRDMGTENAAALPVVRLAVLADHATQQFVEVLKAAMLEQGFFPVVYEAEYATAAFEAYDPNSKLFAFRPDFVFLSFAVQKYRARFLETEEPQAREQLPGQYLDEVMGIADAIAKAGISCIVSNFALPVERQFGSYGALTRQSIYGSTLEFNHMLHAALARRGACHLNDVMYIANSAGSAEFFDERLWASAKYLCANRFLPDIARSVARVVAVHKGHLTKCLVLDLDNTLWGGVIGDDGMEGIKLGGDAYGEAFQLFQKYILSLKRRGYVLAVCSKNTEAVAMEAIRNHPEMIVAESDIAVFAINWNDKASNIEFIARTLNLGLDSFVFVDDSPFERAQVRGALPMVRVPEMPEDVADYISVLENSGVFEAAGHSEADYTRNQQYREEALRSSAEVQYGSIDEFLASLDMRMNCGPFRAEDLPRVAQLIQRSNQFNLRTQRLSEADCERAMRETDTKVTVQARLRDKFGDYGLISVLCCEADAGYLRVVEFVMSCRVLNRGVETFLFNHLFAEAARLGLTGVRGEYIATAKNAMVKDLYKKFGFELEEDDGRRQTWSLPIARYAAGTHFIQQADE